jgi:hypothetical protein
VNTLEAIRSRLLDIAADATTAAEALDGAAADYLPAALPRLLTALDAVGERQGELLERLAVGVDPQRAGGVARPP